MSEVVVVTGATSGVGRAVAQRFARDGAKIALLGRTREALAGAVAEVEAAGGAALPLPNDVVEFDQVEAAADAVEEAFGPIDIWINKCDDDGLRVLRGHRAARVPARNGGDVSRSGVGDAGSAEAHAAGNLFESLPEDPGAHGRFDDRAHPRSLQLGVAKHRRAVGTALLAAGGLIVAAARR